MNSCTCNSVMGSTISMALSKLIWHNFLYKCASIALSQLYIDVCLLESLIVEEEMSIKYMSNFCLQIMFQLPMLIWKCVHSILMSYHPHLLVDVRTDHIIIVLIYLAISSLMQKRSHLKTHNIAVDPHFSRAFPLDSRDSLFIFCEKLFSFGKVGTATYFILF